MNQLLSQAIVLRRVNYGEADRIITVLTPADGKLGLVARGVRRPKSKLAGAIELFSISDLTYMRGRSGGLGTLVSARLQTHYGDIVKNLARVQLGYDLIAMLDRSTEDVLEQDYFTLLANAFAALNDADISVELIRIWFLAQLLTLAGLAPNLTSDASGERLQADTSYDFDYDSVAFTAAPEGDFAAPQIKFLRLLFADNVPRLLQTVQGSVNLVATVEPLVKTLAATYMRLT